MIRSDFISRKEWVMVSSSNAEEKYRHKLSDAQDRHNVAKRPSDGCSHTIHHPWKYLNIGLSDIQISPFFMDTIAQIGPRGQLTLPASARKNLGLKPGDTLPVHIEGADRSVSSSCPSSGNSYGKAHCRICRTDDNGNRKTRKSASLLETARNAITVFLDGNILFAAALAGESFTML
jgi:AbrB family looped-hinge helix DNA binding protein